MISRLIPVLILTLLPKWLVHGSLTTEKVDFRKLNLTSIPTMSVDQTSAKGITRIIFSHNALEELSNEDFDTLSQFSNTKYIFFDNNRISHVARGTFARLPHLKHIDLSRNQLSEVSDDLYRELTKLTRLKYLNLKRNPFRVFSNIYRLLQNGIDVDFDGMLNRNRKRRLVNSTEVNDVQGGRFSSHELLEEDHENRTITDKPRKAMVVDTKGKPHNYKPEDDKDSKTMGSIIFNLFTAGLILVALPIGMVIYYLLSRRRDYL